MAKLKAFQISGLNLKLNPFSQRQGELIRAVNVTNDFFGGKTKRLGYGTFLNAPENANVKSLFQWTKNDGTSSWLYAAIGSTLYHYDVGLGTSTAWVKSPNGTITAGSSVGFAVLEDTLIIGDGVSATRHTTNGTSFTNTTNAPIAAYFSEFNQRIYAGGTSSDMFWSTTGTATDWDTDSSSIRIPGAGKINGLFKQNNRLVPTKNSGLVFKYDGDNLFDLATDLGPSSSRSIAEKEDVRFWLNRDGIFAFTGVKPELISTHIERQIYNDAGNGIPGGNFDTNQGVVFRYDLLMSAGTVKDDFTDVEVPDAILKYNILADEWVNWQFNDFPTSWGKYKDNGGTSNLVFGNASGQVFKYGGSNYDDNTVPIASSIEGVLHFGTPENEKEFRYIWAFFNPGSRAKVQVAIADTFTKGKKKWVSLGDAKNGVAEVRFPEGSRGRLLFWKIYESGKTPPYKFYGFTVDLNVVPDR